MKDFIGEKSEEGQQEPAKQNKNIIEQESPELHSFVDQEIRKGRKPIEAAALAQKDKRFSNVIKKLMKTHKTSWSNIIESIFGSGEESLRQSGLKQFNEKMPTTRCRTRQDAEYFKDNMGNKDSSNSNQDKVKD